MHFVYILESASTKKWHYGSTIDLLGQLESHNKGWNKSTRGRGPWSYTFVRPFDTQAQAFEFERYLKRIRNRALIAKKFALYFRYGMYTIEVEK